MGTLRYAGASYYNGCMQLQKIVYKLYFPSIAGEMTRRFAVVALLIPLCIAYPSGYGVDLCYLAAAVDQRLVDSIAAPAFEGRLLKNKDQWHS